MFLKNEKVLFEWDRRCFENSGKARFRTNGYCARELGLYREDDRVLSA